MSTLKYIVLVKSKVFKIQTQLHRNLFSLIKLHKSLKWHSILMKKIGKGASLFNIPIFFIQKGPQNKKMMAFGDEDGDTEFLVCNF